MHNLTRFLAVLLLSISVSTTTLAKMADPTSPPPRQPLRVLFIGNSLTYVNNLPRLVQAVAVAQPGGPKIVTTSFVEAGGSLDERWKDGNAADALRSGHWDALVLQESSGLPACLANSENRRTPRCRASVRAHKRFAELAKISGARVLLLMTWGPDSSWQRNIDQGYDMLAFALRGDQVPNEIVPAARALDTYAAQHTWKAALPDGLHPSLSASLIIAAQLYRAISGQPAQAHDVLIDFRLLPKNVPLKPGTPLEQQAHLAGSDKTYLLKGEAMTALLQLAYAPR